MWGTVILRVHLATETDQHVATLNRIRDMPASEDIVHIEGAPSGVTLLFSGQRQGDFITYLCSADHPLRHLPLTALEPPNKYVATRPVATRQMICWLLRNGT